jgi:ABC-2 type transport system permease protein
MIFAMVLLAFITELFISFLVGLIAFWTDEIDGIFDSIIKLRTIFAGAYFPINILPLFFVKLSYALPFAYSFFVPTQLYLNKISLLDGLRGIFIQIAWIVMLYLIIKLVWRCGLKKYESVGI